MVQPAAENAMNHAMNRVIGIVRLLSPAPGRAEFALRLALLCALTAAVTALYQTPAPALTAYVAFFLHRADRAGSIVTTIAMTILITLVLGLLVLVADAVVDVSAWRVASMAALSLGLLFLASASKLRPIGGTVALIVAYALDLLGGVSDGELATRGLLYTWLFVAIPAAITVVLSLLIAPSPRRLVQRALAGRLRAAAAVLRDPEGDATRELSRLLSQGDEQLRGWLHLAGLERTSPPQDIAALGVAAGASVALLSTVDFMARTSGAMPRPVCAALAHTLEDMALIFDRGGYPVDIGSASSRQDPAQDTPGGLPAASLAAIDAAIRRFGDPPPTAPAKEASGFFVPDAFTNPEHLRYAMKTTAAAMLCYVLYSLLDWPGIHTCLITCYIVSLSTVGDSVEKLALRLAGCVAGALLGVGAMVFLVPSFTSVAALMAIVFLGALAGAWVAAGSPRISYAGFQVAFAFLLCVVQGPAPGFDLTVARDRVIGIALGNVVLYLISAHVWPVSVGRRIEAGIAKALRDLSLMMATTDAAMRASLSAQARAALGAVESDLELAGREPVSVRPAGAWLKTQVDVARRMAALEAPLQMIAEQDTAASADIAHRLDRMANARASTGNTGADEHAGPPQVRIPECAARRMPNEPADAATLRGIVDTGLRGLELALQGIQPQEGGPHAMA
jgi:multidrug resistance protein MdtO